MTSTRILLDQVKLVADKHDTDVLLCRVEQSREPVLQVLERLSVCDVINYQAAESFAIVSNRDRPVFLLSGRVPQLRFHCRAIFHRDVLCRKLYADRRSLRLRQLILQVTA